MKSLIFPKSVTNDSFNLNFASMDVNSFILNSDINITLISHPNFSILQLKKNVKKYFTDQFLLKTLYTVCLLKSYTN